MKYVFKEIVGSSSYEVIINDTFIGYFIMSDDGFYYFKDETRNGGLWAAYVLRNIAAMLDEINRPYQEELDKYFENEQRNNGIVEADSSEEDTF